MFANIYKKIVIDFSKTTLFFLAVLISFSLYQAKNFNLDASSDALLLEGDPPPGVCSPLCPLPSLPIHPLLPHPLPLHHSLAVQAPPQ